MKYLVDDVMEEEVVSSCQQPSTLICKTQIVNAPCHGVYLETCNIEMLT